MDVVEFIHDVLRPDKPLGRFPHKVSLHNSCHGVRGAPPVVALRKCGAEI